jgi:fluoride exporter
VTGVALWLGVGVAGAAGTAARFLLHEAARRVRSPFPFGTLAVNVSGTLVLGVLVGAALGGDAYRLAGTGFLGAYTTFSTWMHETHRLHGEGHAKAAWANITVSLGLGLAAAVVGRRLGAALS